LIRKLKKGGEKNMGEAVRRRGDADNEFPKSERRKKQLLYARVPQGPFVVTGKGQRRWTDIL